MTKVTARFFNAGGAQGLFLFSFILLSNSVLADNLDLSEATREAQKTSPKIARAEAAFKEASAKHTETYSGFLPSVNIQALRLLDYKYQTFDVGFNGQNLTVPAIIPNSAVTLNAYLPIFDGFSNIYQFKASSAQERAASDDLDWAKFQLDQDIKLKFYGALAAQKLADVAHQDVKTLEDHLDKTKIQRRGGVSTQFDVLRIEVQLGDAKADELVTQDNLDIARRELVEAMGIENDERTLVGDLPEPLIGLVDKVELPKADRSDVQAQVERDSASYQASRSAAGYLIPKVGLSYQYFYYNNHDNSFFDPTPYRNAWALQFVLTWNIFDGMTSIARSREADAQYEQSERSLQLTRMHIPVEFATWKKRYTTSSVNFKAKSLTVTRAQESVRLALESYRAGTRTNSEVLDATLDLFRARAGVVSAQLSAEEALIRLESVLGRKIASE